MSEQEAPPKLRPWPLCAKCNRPIDPDSKEFGKISWAGSEFEGSDMHTVIHGICPKPGASTVWSR